MSANKIIINRFSGFNRCFFILNSLYVLLIITQMSCKKLVQVDAPVTTINSENVYAHDASAISVVTSMYKKMTADGYFTGLKSISLFAGLSADEWSLYDGVTNEQFIAYYHNALITNNSQAFGTE